MHEMIDGCISEDDPQLYGSNLQPVVVLGIKRETKACLMGDGSLGLNS